MGTLLEFGWLIFLAVAAPPESFFQSAVRPTDPLTPDQQQQAFQLPPGFAVTCFASEPDLQKPLNMAFDGRGRLWVTGSIEYPHAAAAGTGRDTIRILEDTDGDGRADKVTVFADGLNIPMGLYPYRNGVITYSQPHIWFLQDTDGDDVADRREILYRDLGTPRDTHGMQNAFRRGFDGWLYVCHGYANHSVIRGGDGSHIELESGNTYRIRLDGSRVEQYTQGQVNPFGMAITSRGDWITADCHSKPLTLLLRGGCYPSFGRPDDGLGFVPSLMEHSHGSTAISGVAIPTGESFPAPYRNSLLVGNVMTSRVHHDVLHYDGATATAVEQPDFLACNDPWFRPVDLQFGPDGALYVADFYNKIIGHYEVDLNHPERDRHRGRIWRIAPTQNQSKSDPVANPPALGDLTQASAAELVAELASDNLTRRLLATDQLSDRVGTAAVPVLEQSLEQTTNRWVQIHARWALLRLQALRVEQLVDAAKSTDALVRVHAMRMLAEWQGWDADTQSLVLAGLDDPDPHVRRLAAEAAGMHADVALIVPLVHMLVATPASDSYRIQTIRIALRNQLRAAPVAAVKELQNLPHAERRAVADICALVGGSATAEFLLDVVRDSPAGTVSESLCVVCLVHTSDHLPLERTDTWIELVRTHLAGNLALQFQVLDAVQAKYAAANRALPTAVRHWAQELITQVYPWRATSDQWVCVSGDNPWQFENREYAGGTDAIPFLSSLPGGEQKVSVLRSPQFVVPDDLSFLLCGHRGYPDRSPLEGNRVRLCLAEGGHIIREAFPPRSDIATKISWNLSKFAGQLAYVEVVDELDLDAYAWLGVARFSLPELALSQGPFADRSTLTVAAMTAIEQLGLSEYVPQLRSTLAQSALEATMAREIAAANAQTLVALTGGDLTGRCLAELLHDDRLPRAVHRQLCAALAEPGADYDEIMTSVLPSLDNTMQRQVADRLAGSAATAVKLAGWMEEGRLAPQLLHVETLWAKLQATSDTELRARWDTLRQTAPSMQQEVLDRIPKLVEMARSVSTNVEKTNAGEPSAVETGAAVFEKNCAACHKIGTRGNLVGPQLDGIGSRGALRIAEDVLLPNRNVDQTFRVSLVALEDGQVLTGLKRREEGTKWIFANDKGEEFAVDAGEIEEMRVSNTSLMPDGFGTTLSDTELAALLAYLASQVEP